MFPAPVVCPYFPRGDPQVFSETSQTFRFVNLSCLPFTDDNNRRHDVQYHVLVLFSNKKVASLSKHSAMQQQKPATEYAVRVQKYRSI